MYFRTYASAGGLYPVEVYAVTGNLPGVGPGLYHYHPRRRALVGLREGDLRGTLVEATASEPAVAEAPLTLVLTGIPWRTAWKYGPRGFRHLYWDAGMILANLLALAAASGLPARVVMGFDDAALERLLGIDGRHEFPLCLLTIGGGSTAPPAAEVPDLALATRPLSAEEIEYPQTVAAQDSGRLRAGEVAAWRGNGGTSARPMPEVSPGPGDLLENVIRRRGSARSFDPKPIPGAALATILEQATRGVPTDYAPGGSALAQPYLIANRVEGLESGAYRFDGELHLLAAGDFAEEAAYLCLEQPLGHDAAATHFLMADLDNVLGRFGDRGYRLAQLEAGVVAGRMYLAAEAHRLGATGLTFYDDDVTRFFTAEGEAPRSCMLVLALGPATRHLLPLA
jgi:SagB-type dehydrogenase family enzyme